MGFIQRVAAGDNWSAGGVSTITVTVGTATAAGGTILVAIGSGNVSAAVNSLTDTAGNSYAADFVADSIGGSGKNIEIWRCANNKALTTSDTITANLSATLGQGIILFADQFTWLGGHDSSGTTNQSSSSTSCATTVSAAVGDVIMYAACFPNGTVSGLGLSGAFTACGTAQQPANGICGQSAYLVNPSGSPTATFTWTNSHSAVEALAGFPASVPIKSRPLLVPAAVSRAANW